MKGYVFALSTQFIKLNYLTRDKFGSTTTGKDNGSTCGVVKRLDLGYIKK